MIFSIHTIVSIFSRKWKFRISYITMDVINTLMQYLMTISYQPVIFTVFYKAFNNHSAISLDHIHLSVSLRHTRASNKNKFMSLPVRTDAFKYSFFPRIITDWNSLPLAVRLSQSIQSFHGFLLSSASSYHCWSSWHSGGNGWSAPIAGYFTEEPKVLSVSDILGFLNFTK